jgi:folate-binding protein YgfZ
MVSNNIRDLPAGHGNYNFVLSAQGHIQGDGYVYNRGEDFLVVSERTQLEKLLKWLQKYIIMDQVELAELTDELTAIAVQGPLATETLGKAGFQGPFSQTLELFEAHWGEHQFLMTRVPEKRFATYEIWTPIAQAPAVWDALLAAGGTRVGTQAREMLRVVMGAPRYGVDIRERDLPQETGQMRALNFTKGCYLGQEIVERIRSRGNVHRTFTGFVVAGPAPTPGAKVQVENRDIGEITSALTVLASEGERVLALGYVRREFATPGAAVQINGVGATVTPVPFPDVFWPKKV